VLRKIFGPKMSEVSGKFRLFHNEELHDGFMSPSIIGTVKCRRLQWTGHVARMGESRNAYRILVEKPLGRQEEVGG
jgi:hypothetical protein